MQKELPVRKSMRLEGHDYSQNGAYFITVCVKNGHEMLGRVVGATALGRPFTELTPLGECVEETIQKANRDGVQIVRHVIMPNHIHMIVLLSTGDRGRSPLQHVVRNIKSLCYQMGRFFYMAKIIPRPHHSQRRRLPQNMELHRRKSSEMVRRQIFCMIH